MAKKQLVSVRLDEDDLALIDNWVKDQVYYKRSDVVDAAVRLAAWCIRHGYILKLMKFWPKWDWVDNFQLDYHREH